MLTGFTYKLRWPASDHAIYVTINDIFEDVQRRSFEIFINSKNMEHYAWTMALTRTIFAAFPRGRDVSFVLEELIAVLTRGAVSGCEADVGPVFLRPSLGIVERHRPETGFIDANPGKDLLVAKSDGHRRISCRRWGGVRQVLMFQEGCSTCLSCRLSKCC